MKQTWFKQLGYEQNPFLINPFKETTPLIGQEQQLEDAIYYTKSGSILFIQANQGCGKTKFLRTLIDSFRGKIIYVDASKETKVINIEELLTKKNGLSGKLFGSKPKGMVLLLDNVDELSMVNLERLKYYFDQGFLHSVVFTGQDFKAVGFPKSLQQRIGKRIISLDGLTEDQAVALAYARLDEDPHDSDVIISRSQIITVFKASSSPREFLIHLHRVFEEMHLTDADQVTADHLAILKEDLDDEDREELHEELGQPIVDPIAFTTPKGHKIMKIGKYYRCPDVDMFCGNCGAIVRDEDVKCPECFAVFEEEETKDLETKQGEMNA